MNQDDLEDWCCDEAPNCTCPVHSGKNVEDAKDTEDKEFFVAIKLPLKLVFLEEDGDTLLFFSEEEAEMAAENNSLASAFGYEVFQLGAGL